MMELRGFQSILELNKQEHQKKNDTNIDSSAWINELGKASFTQWFNHPLLSYKNLFLQADQTSDVNNKFNVEVLGSKLRSDQEAIRFGTSSNTASIKNSAQDEPVILRKIDTEANIETVNYHYPTEGEKSTVDHNVSTTMKLKDDVSDGKFNNIETNQVPSLSLMNNKISFGNSLFGGVENVSMFEKNVSSLPLEDYLAEESKALTLANAQLKTSPSITLQPIVLDVPVIDIAVSEFESSRITANQNNSATMILRSSSEPITVYFPLRQIGRSDSRVPVRIHVENSADGVNVWIGCDQTNDKLMSAVIKHIESWLRENGLIVSAIFANGQPVSNRGNTKATHLTSDVYRRRDTQSFDDFIPNDLLVCEAFDKYEQNRKGK